MPPKRRKTPTATSTASKKTTTQSDHDDSAQDLQRESQDIADAASITDTAHRMEQLASWLNDDETGTLWIAPGGGWDGRRRGQFPPLEGLLFSLALNGFDTYDVALCVRFFHSFAKPGVLTCDHHFATGDASHPLCNSWRDLIRCVVPETHPEEMDSHDACYFVSPINLQLLQPWLDRLASVDEPDNLIGEIYRFLDRALRLLDVDALRILLNYLPDEAKGSRPYGERPFQRDQEVLLGAILEEVDQNRISKSSVACGIRMICSAFDLPPIFLERAVVRAVKFDSFDVFQTLIECGVGPRSVSDWNTTVKDFLDHFFVSNAPVFGRSLPRKVNGRLCSLRLNSFVEIVISTFLLDTILTKEDKESIVMDCIFSILKRNSGAGYDVSRVIEFLLRRAKIIDPTVPFRFVSHYGTKTKDEFWWQYAAAGGVPTLKVLDPYLSPKPTAAVVARAVFYAFHHNRGSGADGSPNDASTIIQDTLEYLLEYSPDAIRDYDALDETLPGLGRLIQYSTLELALHTKEGTTLVPFLLSHGAFLSDARQVYSCYRKLSGSLDELRRILSHPNMLTMFRKDSAEMMNKALRWGLNDPPLVHILLELGADPTATVDSEPLVVSAAEIGRSALRALSNDGTIKFPPAHLVEALETAIRFSKTTAVCYLCHVLGACICPTISPMNEECNDEL